MKNILDISTQHYFPFYIVLLGFACIPVILIPVYWLLSLGLIVVAALIFTTHYRLRIDRTVNTYREYLWILGFRKGQELPLPGVEYVYINRIVRESEYGLVARLRTRKTLVQGYMKLSNGVSVYIGEGTNEERMMRRATKVSAYFGVRIKKNY
jgi:hypothetical protein